MAEDLSRRFASRADLRTKPPPWLRWTLVCGLAEVVGMAAAATAAGVGLLVVGEPDSWSSGLAVWVLALLGGAVEGLAVGGLQARVLRGWLPELSVRRFVAATVAVALAGWALGMAFPSFVAWQLSPSTASGAEPNQLLMLGLGVTGGALMGAVTGAVFGAAQGWALQPEVLHPRRWVWANVWGWAAGMAVIMLGATAPSGPWPLPQLTALGVVTGLAAGLAVGAVTGLFLSSLVDDAPRGTTWVNRRVLGLLRSPAHRLLSGAVFDLAYQGRRSGRGYALPVQYATMCDAPHTLVVCPGRPQNKTWWRNFDDGGEVTVTLRGVRLNGPAEVTRHDAPALSAYRSRWPKAQISAHDPLVLVRLSSTPEA